MTYHILVTDQIDPDGVALLTAEPAFVVEEVPTLPASELLSRIGTYDAIVGRSATRISGELLRSASKLKVVGRAGVGVDNVALDVATELGIAVVNAPAGNTVAVAELFFGVILGILRQLPAADASMRAGRWDRSALMGTELQGKTLGIVGLGRIGSAVATRAHAFGMSLVAYDPYITEARFQALRVRPATTLDALLEEADIITVHTPLTDETHGMIGRRELMRVSPHAIVVNMARGGIIDEEAIINALRDKTLRAAAIDAFTAEPLASDSPLRTIPNLYPTPHMGASTLEAQRNVAVDVCAAVRDVLMRGELTRSLNVAEIGIAGWEELRPAMYLTRKLAATARAMLASQGGTTNTRAIGKIEVRTGSAFGVGRGALLAAAAIGTLESVTEYDRLNVINARSLAEARGIELSFTELVQDGDTDGERTSGAHAVEVRMSGGVRDISVAGVAHPGTAPRITRIGAFHVDVHPRETLLILTNADVPGVIGRVGTLLGEGGVNIAEYHQARLAQGGEALAAVSVDGTITESTRSALLQLADVHSATVVTFRGEQHDG